MAASRPISALAQLRADQPQTTHCGHLLFQPSSRVRRDVRGVSLVSWGYKPSRWYLAALLVFALPGIISHLLGYEWGFYLFMAAAPLGALDAFFWATRKTREG